MRKIPLLMLMIVLALAACGQAATQAGQPPAGPTPATPTQTSALLETLQPKATLLPTPAPTNTNVPQPTPVATAPSTPQSATAEPTPDHTPGAGSGLSIRPPDALVATARQRLAKRLGVNADTLMLQSASMQEWPDSAIGCPQAGMVYLQVVTPGFLLIFNNTSQSQTYEVHTGRNENQIVLCENNQPTDLSTE